MYKFITKFLGHKAPEPFVIAFEAIPGWVQEREKAAQDKLSEESDTPVQNIRNGVAQLQIIVNNIAGAEQDPSIHPKLKSIAKNSLPLFVRAMNTSLSKELPDDIEEFYTTAVECVKGCLNSSRGQGRYLQVVFPEEMKAVRTGIDALGRELNTLTASIGEYRTSILRLEGVKDLCSELTGIRAELERSEGKDQRMTGRIDEMSGRVDAIEKEIEKIAMDDGMQIIRDLESAMAELELKRTGLNRQYASASMTAAHVFRKAEKIAVKQHHPTEITALRRVMDVLSGHDIPDCPEMDESLSVAGSIALRMVDAGEIPLKNKEERAIFSDLPLFRKELGALCRNLESLNRECSEAELAIQSNPLTTRLHSLTREKAQLGNMIIKERSLQGELSQWRKKSTESIPLLAVKIQGKMEDIIGEAVQIRVEEISQA